MVTRIAWIVLAVGPLLAAAAAAVGSEPALAMIALIEPAEPETAPAPATTLADLARVARSEPLTWFDRRPYVSRGDRLVDVRGRVWRSRAAVVTAYTPRREECDDDPGVTATGTDAFRLPGIAADPRAIPYRSVVRVPGYGEARVDDTGGDMRRAWDRGVLHLDVRIPRRAPDGRWRSEAECVRIALEHGRRHVTVLVLER
jgi:3D (Asp-Asp-Asp) domain-containing protein